MPVDYFLCPSGTEPLSEYFQHPLRYDWPLLEKLLAAEPGSLLSTPDFDFQDFQRRSDTGGQVFILCPVVILDAMVPFPKSDWLFFVDAPQMERRKRIAERDVVWGTNVIARWQHLEMTLEAVYGLQITYHRKLDGMQTIEANIREILDTIRQ